jgi:hypothetical protein
MTYSLGGSQYHRLELLNDRVRNGNGCIQPDMVTGKMKDVNRGIDPCRDALARGATTSQGSSEKM